MLVLTQPHPSHQPFKYPDNSGRRKHYITLHPHIQLSFISFHDASFYPLAGAARLLCRAEPHRRPSLHLTCLGVQPHRVEIQPDWGVVDAHPALAKPQRSTVALPANTSYSLTVQGPLANYSVANGVGGDLAVQLPFDTGNGAVTLVCTTVMQMW